MGKKLTFVVDWRDGFVAFLAGTIPKLESDIVVFDLSVLEGKIIANGGGDFLDEPIPGEHSDERGLADSAATDKANLDELINTLLILLHKLQQ